MITGKDVRLEMETTGKVIDDSNATMLEKLKAVYKMVTVLAKLGLSIRTNTKLLMEKTGAKPLPPRRRTEEKEEKAE